MFILSLLCFHFSEACSIELDDQLVVTGGVYYPTRVDVYTTDGWIMELPNLIDGRLRHGCGHYVNSYNKMVNCKLYCRSLSHIIVLAGFSVCVTRPYVTILKILYVCLTKYVRHKALPI